MVDIIQFQYITKQMNVYVGLFILVLGVIGNTLNALIFANVRTSFARNPCSHYFIAIAMIDLLCLLIGFLSKILASGFDIDPTTSSVVFCKFRSFFVYIIPLISTNLTCLATIFQFLNTSRHARYWQKANLRLIRWIILVTVLFWIFHGIPYIILYDIHLSSAINMLVCNSVNVIMNQYTTWMTFNILIFIIPNMILFIFGYLTYRNIVRSNLVGPIQTRTSGQRIQRQLTVVSNIYYILNLSSIRSPSLLSLKIVLTQIVWLVVCSSPSGLNSLYTFFTGSQAKSTERKTVEQLINTLVSYIFYMNYVGL